MPANTSPIFPLTPNVSWVNIPASVANTAKDGTGTNYLVHTAGANGSLVSFIRLRALGTNVATVVRVFLNNGATPATASNNTFITEAFCAATTNSENSALNEVQIALNVPIPAGYKLYLSIATSVASGFAATCFAGDY